MTEQLDRVARTPPPAICAPDGCLRGRRTVANPHQCYINAIGRGPTHHPGNNHCLPAHRYDRRLSDRRPKASRRTCSPSSHNLRVSFSTVAGEGNFRGRSTLEFLFLNASTGRVASRTLRANLESCSAV